MRSDPCPEALDAALLAEAVELSRLSPPSPAAYAVGAVVVGAGAGAPRSVGWSRRHDPLDHAEEVALAAFPATRPAARSTARWNRAHGAAPAGRPAPS